MRQRKDLNFNSSLTDSSSHLIAKKIQEPTHWYYAAAKLLQACPTLCSPIDGSTPGSPVPGILQARTLEWVAIFFSSAWKWKVKEKSLSHVRLPATPWTEACQAPPFMGFSRQKSTGVGCHCFLHIGIIGYLISTLSPEQFWMSGKNYWIILLLN